jgi:hypothetical protein
VEVKLPLTPVSTNLSKHGIAPAFIMKLSTFHEAPSMPMTTTSGSARLLRANWELLSSFVASNGTLLR